MPMIDQTAGIWTRAAARMRPSWPPSPVWMALTEPALTPTTTSSSADPARAMVRWLRAHVDASHGSGEHGLDA